MAPTQINLQDDFFRISLLNFYDFELVSLWYVIAKISWVIQKLVAFWTDNKFRAYQKSSNQDGLFLKGLSALFPRYNHKNNESAVR